MIFGFVIWSIVSVIFLGIGISSWKSKEVVGFFTSGKPTEITANNVKKYNHAVAILWFISAIILEILGIPLLFIEQNSVLFVPIIFAVIVLVIVMMIVYVRIETSMSSSR